MYLLYLIPNPAAKRLHFGGSALALDKLTLLGWHPFGGSQVQIYVGFVALVLNLLVAVVVTPVLRARRVPEGADATSPADFHADEGSQDLRPVAEPIGEGAAVR
jgi:solute:Na+ symporter, SSS family